MEEPIVAPKLEADLKIALRRVITHLKDDKSKRIVEAVQAMQRWLDAVQQLSDWEDAGARAAEKIIAESRWISKRSKK